MSGGSTEQDGCTIDFHAPNITVTGTTIRDNDLKIIKDGIVFESQASLIGKKSLIPETLDSSKDLKKIINQILSYKF